MNRSEEYVYQLCNHSFLSLWSYVSPQGKEGRELCDVLIVCDPDIVIISVKEITLKRTGDLNANLLRWQKSAIDKSCKQIYGAERWICTAKHVIRQDGKPGIDFPEPKNRRIHRIAVALGSY